jgi:hypothetical protein
LNASTPNRSRGNGKHETAEEGNSRKKGAKDEKKEKLKISDELVTSRISPSAVDWTSFSRFPFFTLFVPFCGYSSFHPGRKDLRFAKLSAEPPGKGCMRINNNLFARPLSWAALLTAITLALPALGQTTTYPLRLRGSANLATSYNNGSLVIEFERGSAPAGDGLQPGEGSWLDRGFRPTEPDAIVEMLAEDQAKEIVDYLTNPNHYATFYCANSNQGYFVAASSAPFVLGSAIPQGSSSALLWATVLHAHDDAGSPGDGSDATSDDADSGNLGSGTAGSGQDPRNHRDEKKDRHEAGKERHDEGKSRHDKEHHEKDHRGGTENHGVMLVKPQAKPLIKHNNPAPAKPAPKSAPRPTPKKKK